MTAEGGGCLNWHNHKKVDILREWSLKANVTALKFTCKTNYCCEIWVYIIVLFFFLLHCGPCHYIAAFSKLCADKPPSKCITNFIGSFMAGSKLFNRFGNVNNIEINGIHRQWTQRVYWRARSEPGVTRRSTGGVKGKLANGVSSQYSHATSEHGLSSITQADAHTSAASSRLNWRPHLFKWTRPFRAKTKSGFCACAITFRTSYTTMGLLLPQII